MRYLDEYPGGPKGPKPEDDIDFFIQYAYKKIPPILATELAARNTLLEAQKGKKKSADMTEM